MVSSTHFTVVASMWYKVGLIPQGTNLLWSRCKKLSSSIGIPLLDNGGAGAAWWDDSWRLNIVNLHLSDWRLRSDGWRKGGFMAFPKATNHSRNLNAASRFQSPHRWPSHSLHTIGNVVNNALLPVFLMF